MDNREQIGYYNNTIGRKIFRGTIIIVLVGILAKLASFVLEAVLAAYLGTTRQSDAYYIVWSVHGVIYPMMSIGIWKVFLPLYKSYISRQEMDKAYALTNKVLSFFTVLSFIAVILILLLAPFIITIVAPGFKNGTRELCIKLVRISAPQYVFIIASAVYASILQCHEKFLGSQIREVVSHVPTIIAAVFFYRLFGVESLAVGLIIAGIVRLLIELPFVSWGYIFRPDFNFKDDDFVLMLQRLPSALVSAGVAQLNTLVDKAMASILPEGTISCINYGHKLMNVFSGLLSSAIATAMYPQMIELIALGKKEELGKLIIKIINIFSLLMIPVTIACILFRTEMVSVAFERGAFDSHSTELTSCVFALYCVGLFFVASNTVLSNVFYGHGDTKTAMKISLANLGINIGLNIILIRILGVSGLAFATSASAIITFFIRFHAVKKYMVIGYKKMFKTSTKVILSSCIACFIPRIIFWIHPLGKILVLLASMFIGVFLYLISIRLLGVEESDDLLLIIKRKFMIQR